MSPLDWAFVALPLIIVLTIVLYAQRYMKSVADFMSSNRLAGPYLLAVARGELQAGAVVFVASFEIISHSGLSLGWWGWISGPIGILIAMSGFVIYRYRETRAMTLGQFFEIRYSKPFRVFAGALGFFAGIMNFGIIPAVGARFLVYILGFPPELHWGTWSIPTYIPLMGFFLCITLGLALSGGLLTVMIADCVEGIIAQLGYLVIIAAVLLTFSWKQMSEVLSNRPPHQSFLNPFDSMGLADFNPWYVLLTVCVGVYGTMAWQNASAYNSAAITPHASVMGGLLARWREMGKGAVITLLAIGGMTYLSHPDFAAQAQSVHSALNQIADPHMRTQMEIPIAVTELLPIGVKGILCALLLMGIFGGDSTHLHSWGGIFVQDVLVPLRKKPFTPKQHIRILRISIIGVALFAFLFGSLFRQTSYIGMWWTITTAVFVGGAGSVIIGGLYWKKGTTAGAWVALITGAVLSLTGILIRQFSDGHFPLNFLHMAAIVAVVSISLYIGVSLLTCKEDFNLDRMLHRGPYAAIKESVGETIEQPQTRTSWWARLLGFSEHYTFSDKLVASGLLGWSIFFAIVFLVGTAWNLIAPWPLSWWATFWHIVGIGLPVLMAFITAIWFTWGGVRDIRRLFRSLAAQRVNALDDGTVVGHHNLDEEAPKK